jgi:hypothetical protein
MCWFAKKNIQNNFFLNLNIVQSRDLELRQINLFLWIGDCCFTPNEQCFIDVMARPSYILMMKMLAPFISVDYFQKHVVPLNYLYTFCFCLFWFFFLFILLYIIIFQFPFFFIFFFFVFFGFFFFFFFFLFLFFNFLFFLLFFFYFL